MSTREPLAAEDGDGKSSRWAAQQSDLFTALLMTFRKIIQIGLSALLVLATVFAFAVTIVRAAWTSGESLVLLIWLVVFASGAVVCIAWTANLSRERLRRIAGPFLAFNLINGAAWLVGTGALIMMEHGLKTRNDISSMGHWFLAAHRFHMFTMIAVASACATAYAAWKRNPGLLATTGSAMILVWLAVLGLGFLVASVHLIAMH